MKPTFLDMNDIEKKFGVLKSSLASLTEQIGLYAGTLSVVWSFQAGEINSFIAKAVNESFFVILGDSSITHVVNYFNTNHKAVAVFCEFKDAIAANAIMFLNEFARAVTFSDLDAMWAVVHKIMVFSADGTFRKNVKASCSASSKDFASLLETWNRLDSGDAAEVKSLFISGSSFDAVHSELVMARKSYRSSKLLESRCAKEFHIKQAICKKMENFELNKSHIIRSVLEHPFCKMVLDYLVVDKELVLEPKLVKSKIDTIMEGWTKRHWVYVFDEAFSGVMCSIEFNKLYEMVFHLPDGKAAGLSACESVPGSWKKA
ncbi:hypothetical protein G9A89_010903 [Geosiphon pyriformis]|nr:hypothetical protein G9A89_010903 [Geosiphon pyriformis]